MRWEPRQLRAGKVGEQVILWLSSPLWGTALAVFFAMVGAVWLKRWIMGPTTDWRPWWAWYPVTTNPWPDEERTWLEWVERRSPHVLADGIHRTVERKA